MSGREERWKAALHEAGHAAYYVQAMNAKTVDCAIRETGAGVAIPLGYSIVSENRFEGAVVAACGQQAERLAATARPPRRRKVNPTPSPAMDTLSQERREIVSSRIDEKGTKSDAEKIALYACAGTAGIEEHPRQWPARALRVKANARLFVIRHRVEIITLAKALFTAGHVVWPNTKRGDET